ncbi:MAG TPA: response regulator transcription factor [Magnetospirillum sp.]|nr:response regulator transcription factor [Magnetospirillum sp.]
MRVLVIEDETELGELMVEHLRRQGFAADLVACLDEAEAAVATSTFDALVLDFNLPDGDGQDFLHRLRQGGNWVPVLAATARDAIDQRVRSLDLGADDYLTKPFDLRELTARLRALLRRPSGTHGLTLTAGNMEFHTVTRGVTVNGVRIALHRRQLALLEILLQAQGRVVPRASIEDRMYGFDDRLESNALESQISRLRKALSDCGATVSIVTARGLGYMLTGAPP